MEHREEWSKKHKEDWNPKSKVILAVFMIGAGILLLANNFNILPNTILDHIFSWPMLLIAIGILQIVKHPNKVFGMVLLGIGGFFLLTNVLDFHISLSQVFWPIFFLGIGILILFKGNTGKRNWKKDDFNTSEFIDEVTLFGGTERRITSKNFKGGETVSIFGGTVYDFTECELAEGKNVLEVVNIFGGSKFIIPSHWNVHVEVVSIFGGFSDKRKSGLHLPENHNKELYIKGVAIFGGGEIKSF